jgi:hypothetical protein
MLGLVGVSFAVNGRAPGGVNLRPKDLAEMTAPTGGRPGHLTAALKSIWLIGLLLVVDP